MSDFTLIINNYDAPAIEINNQPQSEKNNLSSVENSSKRKTSETATIEPRKTNLPKRQKRVTTLEETRLSQQRLTYLNELRQYLINKYQFTMSTDPKDLESVISIDLSFTDLNLSLIFREIHLGFKPKSVQLSFLHGRFTDDSLAVQEDGVYLMFVVKYNENNQDIRKLELPLFRVKKDNDKYFFEWTGSPSQRNNIYAELFINFFYAGAYRNIINFLNEVTFKNRDTIEKFNHLFRHAHIEPNMALQEVVFSQRYIDYCNLDDFLYFIYKIELLNIFSRNQNPNQKKFNERVLKYLELLKKDSPYDDSLNRISDSYIDNLKNIIIFYLDCCQKLLSKFNEFDKSIINLLDINRENRHNIQIFLSPFIQSLQFAQHDFENVQHIDFVAVDESHDRYDQILKKLSEHTHHVMAIVNKATLIVQDLIVNPTYHKTYAKSYERIFVLNQDIEPKSFNFKHKFYDIASTYPFAELLK